MTIVPADDFVAGGTYTFKLVASKDGVVWDITGATIYLVLRRGRSIVSRFAATITNASGGIAQYTTTTEDLKAGNYLCSWQVSQGSIVVESPSVPFPVADALYP